LFLGSRIPGRAASERSAAGAWAGVCVGRPVRRGDAGGVSRSPCDASLFLHGGTGKVPCGEGVPRGAGGPARSTKPSHQRGSLHHGFEPEFEIGEFPMAAGAGPVACSDRAISWLLWVNRAPTDSMPRK